MHNLSGAEDTLGSDDEIKALEKKLKRPKNIEIGGDQYNESENDEDDLDPSKYLGDLMSELSPHDIETLGGMEKYREYLSLKKAATSKDIFGGKTWRQQNHEKKQEQQHDQKQPQKQKHPQREQKQQQKRKEEQEEQKALGENQQMQQQQNATVQSKHYLLSRENDKRYIMLQKQTKGMINRISEQNVEKIILEILKLFPENSKNGMRKQLGLK